MAYGREYGSSVTHRMMLPLVTFNYGYLKSQSHTPVVNAGYFLFTLHLSPIKCLQKAIWRPPATNMLYDTLQSVPATNYGVFRPQKS